VPRVRVDELPDGVVLREMWGRARSLLARGCFAPNGRDYFAGCFASTLLWRAALFL
jgi:hypothetical protein